jgi:hypothetical protein
MPYLTVKPAEIQRKVRDGLRLSQPKNCPPDIYSLMSSCWRHDRAQRPAFFELHRELMTYLRVWRDPIRDVAAVLAAANAGAK